MGFELDRLMRQFGVATPTIASAPTQATDASRAAYEQYRRDYQDRVQSTPQYLAAQYGLGPTGSAAEQWWTQQRGEQGPTEMAQNIRQTLGATPNLTNQQIAAAQQQYGISNRDIYNATGNYWGNLLQAPTPVLRPAMPAGDTRTPQSLADYYRTASNRGMTEAEMVNQARGAGVSDAQMNAARNVLLGVPENTSWEEANRLAAQPGYTMPTTPVTAPATGLLVNTPQGIADYARQLAAAGMTEEQIIQQARARGVTDAQMVEARNLLLGRPLGTAWSGASAAPMTNNPTTTNPTTQTYYEQPSGYAHGGGVHKLAQKYARGGSSRDDEKQEFETEVSLGSDVPEMIAPRSVEAIPEPVRMTPQQIEAAVAPVTASPAAQPVALPMAAATPMSPAANDLMAMLQRYQTESVYAPELRAARERAAQESARFEQLIQQMANQPSAAPDKSEMYFRLAAAFGAPTRTGSFAESLGAAGKVMGEYTAEQRAARKADEQLRRQLGLEAAKLRMGAAREDVESLRGLAAEEMKDRRAVVAEYLKSGRPQSEAGKIAEDMNLKRGTPEYNKFVSDYVERQVASGEMYKAGLLALAQGNQGIAREGLALRQEEQAGKTAERAKLSPTETKLVLEAEQSVGALQDSMTALDRAFKLNPQTFDGTYQDIARRKVLEEINPNDPRVLATREQTNLLGRGAIEKLKASFGGNPTEGERAALMQLEGIDSKSKAERAQIMANTYDLLRKREQRERDRLQRIRAGQFRTTTPIAGEGAE